MSDSEFARVFRAMAKEVRDLNTAKGREKKNTFAEYIALLHYEVSEMLEEWRNRNEDELRLEYADVLIRLINMADVFGIDLYSAYADKMDRNWKRPYLHGAKTL